jgi:nucleotide-binding universal stress UspA family protein
VTTTEGEPQRDPLRVLVAIDGSAPSATAIDLVAGVSWPPGTEFIVAEAVESGPGLFGGSWPALALVETESLEADIRAEAERTVHEALGRLERPGLNVDAVVLRGRPAGAIIERARAMRADLIIVGSRGHGRIESMLLGSVSAELIDHAPIPVLVARNPRMERILLAWDGSSGASRAAEMVRTLPIFAGTSVRVVTVADIEVPWWTGFPQPGSAELMPIYLEAAEAARSERDRLALEMTTRLQAAGLSAEADVREGDAATQILAAAGAAASDLIVMGSHGRTGLAPLVLGSVARNVLQHATCSVLVARQGTPRSETGARSAD